ncbi:MAG: hypothetical protein H6702_17305 [Myxococcales bacterium]|nr:hypothetical protein [Myxococcales bacterium]
MRRNIELRIQVGGDLFSLTTLANPPPRYGSPGAMAQFHKQFPKQSEQVWAPDHWAITKRWDASHCSLDGWHKAAGVSCDVFKAPCDTMPAFLALCGSVRPGDGPSVPASGPAVAFPELQPLAAAEVAASVARAFARKDAAALAAHVQPDGLRLLDKPVAPAALAQALESGPFAKAVAAHAGAYLWNAGKAHEGRARVYFSTGYGEQPYFDVAQVGERWVLAAVGIEDLGEP